MDKLIIREAVPSDIPALLDIYSYYILETAVTFENEIPTPEEFENRMRNFKKRYPYLAAELNGKIVGYSYAHALIDRAACLRSCEMTIYLDHEYRGKGIGKQLYTKMEELLEKMGIINLYSSISIPLKEDKYLTFDSERFHSHMGYRRAGLFEKFGYKFGNWYDLIWMEKIIAEHEEIPAELKKVEYC